MPTRFPESLKDHNGLARYTRDKWRALEPMYAWWTEYRWRRVVDFLTANHWRVLEAVDSNLEDPRIPKWKKYPIIGLTLGVYSDILAQWLQSEVRYSAVATSGDPADIARAELGEAVLKYCWDVTDMKRIRIDLAAWLLATGCGSLVTHWDMNTGDLIPLGIPEEDELGRPTGGVIPINPATLEPDPTMREPVMVDAGELAVEVCSPQFARYGRSPREGAMVGSRLTYDEVYDLYGKNTAENVSYAKTVSTVLDLSWIHGGADTAQDERALIIRHFTPRSFRHPDGLWWTSTEQGQLLTPAAPLVGKRVSVVPFRWTPIVGYWAFGLTPLYAVSHSNKAADLAKQKQQEWLEKVKPKVLFKTGGGLAPGDFNEEPAQEVPGVNAGGEPEFLVPPAYPPELEKERQNSLEEGLLVAGYQFERPPDALPGEVVRGRTRQPPKRKEGGEAKLGLICSEPSWEQQAKVLLGFVGKFYSDERIIAIGGPDTSYQLYEFRGTDFSNLAASIHVSEVPYYPDNRQTLRDTVVALVSTPAGQVFFSGPDGELDREKLQKAAEAVGVDVALSTLDPDVMEARNEISLMRIGREVQYQSFQNSEVHLVEKLKTVKSLSFHGWKPESKEMLLGNIQDHQDALRQQQAEAEQALADQERQLRTIRAETEAMGEGRKMLIEKLLDLAMGLMEPEQTQESK